MNPDQRQAIRNEIERLEGEISREQLRNYYVEPFDRTDTRVRKIFHLSERIKRLKEGL